MLSNFNLIIFALVFSLILCICQLWPIKCVWTQTIERVKGARLKVVHPSETGFREWSKERRALGEIVGASNSNPLLPKPMPCLVAVAQYIRQNCNFLGWTTRFCNRIGIVYQKKVSKSDNGVLNKGKTMP